MLFFVFFVCFVVDSFSVKIQYELETTSERWRLRALAFPARCGNDNIDQSPPLDRLRDVILVPCTDCALTVLEARVRCNRNRWDRCHGTIRQIAHFSDEGVTILSRHFDIAHQHIRVPSLKHTERFSRTLG